MKFIETSPSFLSEMITYGEVSENFSNLNEFLLDKECSGNNWHLLRSVAGHLTRSTVLYYSTAKKQDAVITCVEAKIVNK